MTGRSLVRSI